MPAVCRRWRKLSHYGGPGGIWQQAWIQRSGLSLDSNLTSMQQLKWLTSEAPGVEELDIQTWVRSQLLQIHAIAI